MVYVINIGMVMIVAALWGLLCGKFKLKWKDYLLYAIASITLLQYSVSLENICLNALFCILVLVSITDAKYFEIEPFTYFFLLIPTVVLLLVSERDIPFQLIVFAVLFISLFLGTVIFKGDNIGGADIKIMLILSLVVPFDSLFLWILFIAAACLVLAITYYCSAFIQSKRKKIDFDKKYKPVIPMLIAITAGTYLVLLI